MRKSTEFVSAIESKEVLVAVAIAVAEKAMQSVPAGHPKTEMYQSARHNIEVAKAGFGDIRRNSFGCGVSAAACSQAETLVAARILCADAIDMASYVWGSPQTYDRLEIEYINEAKRVAFGEQS